MAGPYTCTKMLLKIDTNTVGVVTGSDIGLQREGAGIQFVYGSETGYHVIGGKKATFTLQRWYMTDTDTDLLYDLFNDKIPFSLSGEIDGKAGSQLTLSNAVAYTWKFITGDANTTVGEEVTGEAVTWAASIA